MSAGAISRPRWELAAGLGVGLIGGVLALTLQAAEMRWFMVYLGATIAIPTAFLLRHAYELHLRVFVLALQAYMCFTFMPLGGGFVGYSAPGGYELHLAPMLAAGALMFRLPSLIGRFRWGGEVMPAALVMLVPMLFSVSVSRHPFFGLLSLINLTQCYIVYLGIVNLVRSEKDARIAIAMCLAICVIQGIVITLQYTLGVTFTLSGEVIDRGHMSIQRHGGTVSTHPSTLSQFMNLFVPSAVALYFAAGKIAWRRWALLPAVFGCLALLLTFTRAAWMAFIIASFLIVVVSQRRGWMKVGSLVPIAVAGLILCAIFAEPILAVFNKEHGEDYDERAALLEMAMMVIRAEPWTGVGWGAYAVEFRSYLQDRFLFKKWLFVVHNYYALRTAECGIPGLIGLLIFLFAGFRLAWRCTKLRSPVSSRIALGIFAGMWAFWLHLWLDIGISYQLHFAYWFQLGMLEALRWLERDGVLLGAGDDDPPAAFAAAGRGS